MQIKKGDIVGRLSYNSDILFFVHKIIDLEKRAILKGINIRIEADAPIEDLRKIDSKKVNNFIRSIENTVYKQLESSKIKFIENTGKIFHLDGDTHLGNQKYIKSYKW